VSVTGSTAAVEVVDPRDPRAAVARADASASDFESVRSALLRNYPGLVDVLARRARNEQLARDVLQDAIVTTLAKLSDGVPMSADVLAGYVFRTAMNHLRNHRRREQAWVADDGAIEAATDESASPADASQRDATRGLVRRVLANLDSPRDREVLVRFYLHEQEKQQICDALGLSALHFDKVIHRARERMKRGLERVGMRPWDLLLVLVVVAAFASIG
jgi:RNA polymerase sigma-70 factor (ECF subfamily)